MGSGELEGLLAEADSHPVTGWDFSWLGDRLVSRVPWDFEEIVLRRARAASDLLDLGTGGGERLAAMPYRPARTVATEAWEPNVEFAGARLRPLGVTLVWDEGAPDNVDQRPEETRGRLPFAAGSFELVTSRHEAFVASEVARVLVDGGRFLTQQVGGDYDDLHALLGLPVTVADRPAFDLRFAVGQVERAGFTVVSSDEGEEVTTFADVGAIAWYLRAVAWAVPTFTIGTYRNELTALNERIVAGGPVSVRQPAFWLEAVKRSGGRGARPPRNS